MFVSVYVCMRAGKLLPEITRVLKTINFLLWLCYNMALWIIKI